MKALLQRTTGASVSVSGKTIGEIRQGIVIFLGIEKNDSVAMVQQGLNKIINYRIFSDSNGKMNLSAKDIHADLLIISQFTLATATRKGLRPGFSCAAHPNDAKAIYEEFVTQAIKITQGSDSHIATGEFGADMQVSLINDGPVTFLLEF